MTAWICRTCGVQHEDTEEPPTTCEICVDERQYVGHDGQRWTTMAELLETSRNDVREEEPDLLGIGAEPPIAIGQRALLVQTPARQRALGLRPGARRPDPRDRGVARRHHGDLHVAPALLRLPRRLGRRLRRDDPHPACGRAVDPASVAADRAVRRLGEPVEGLEMVRIGGHFDGASVLHWPAGSGGGGALLTGDTIMVVRDREWVSFMWSFPNLIPLDEHTVEDIAARVERLRFDRVYGGWWGAVVVADGAAAVRRSADRYVARLRGERPKTVRVCRRSSVA